MNIPTVRNSFKYESSKLRRARRLYFRFVFKEVKRNPEIAYICAQRALARGLYAKSTGLNAVVFSIVRGIYKIDCAKKGLDPRENWGIWLNANPHASWHTGTRFAVGKPRLRLVA